MARLCNVGMDIFGPRGICKWEAWTHQKPET